MRWTLHALPKHLALASAFASACALGACGDDDQSGRPKATTTNDAGEPIMTPPVITDSAAGPASPGAQDGSAPSQSTADGGGVSPGQGDAGANVDEEPTDPFGAEVGPFGTVKPDPKLGLLCHMLEVNGKALIPQVVVAPHPAPQGGTITPGMYHLIAEDHYIRPGASPTEIESCSAYWGIVRETLSVSPSEIQRAVRIEEERSGLTRGRQTIAYTTEGDRMSRTQFCPGPEAGLPPLEPSVPFTATSEELWIFESAENCDYLYKYRRAP